jgi:hypothetical protein
MPFTPDVDEAFRLDARVQFGSHASVRLLGSETRVRVLGAAGHVPVALDPKSTTWTVFDYPVRGTEVRHIALLEREGKTYVVMPVYRTNNMGVLTLRSEAEIAALKAKAE